ncbi:MAG: copper chaperone PCu(A)C, partial [Ignavibacteriae bacterium]|nr:copper chaperone PCu(A)C [Ignavibacteriota bacterium]
MKKISLILIIASLLFLSISCNNQKNETATNSKSEKPIEIKNERMSPAAKNRNSAVYFTITNNSKFTDTLYQAVSELAQVTELHETYEISE